MSRAGAVATRGQKRSEKIADAIAEKGLLVAAMESWLEREGEAIQRAEVDIDRLLTQIGLPVAETFVLDEFEDMYSPRYRVCVRMEGLVLNYRPSGEDYKATLSLVAGKCTKCGRLPALWPVSEISDLAYVATPAGKRWLAEFECYRCKETA